MLSNIWYFCPNSCFLDFHMHNLSHFFQFPRQIVFFPCLRVFNRIFPDIKGSPRVSRLLFTNMVWLLSLRRLPNKSSKWPSYPAFFSSPPSVQEYHHRLPETRLLGVGCSTLSTLCSVSFSKQRWLLLSLHRSTLVKCLLFDCTAGSVVLAISQPCFWTVWVGVDESRSSCCTHKAYHPSVCVLYL